MIESKSDNGINNDYPQPEVIRRLRKAAGFTSMEQIARAVGVCSRAMQHYEDGTRRMRDVRVCLRFAAAVGVPLDVLLGRGSHAAAPSVQPSGNRTAGGGGAAA